MNQVKQIRLTEGRDEGGVTNYIVDANGDTIGEVYNGSDAEIIKLCVNAFIGVTIVELKAIIASRSFRQLLHRKS